MDMNKTKFALGYQQFRLNQVYHTLHSLCLRESGYQNLKKNCRSIFEVISQNINAGKTSFVRKYSKKI